MNYERFHQLFVAGWTAVHHAQRHSKKPDTDEFILAKMYQSTDFLDVNEIGWTSGNGMIAKLRQHSYRHKTQIDLANLTAYAYVCVIQSSYNLQSTWVENLFAANGNDLTEIHPVLQAEARKSGRNNNDQLANTWTPPLPDPYVPHNRPIRELTDKLRQQRGVIVGGLPGSGRKTAVNHVLRDDAVWIYANQLGSNQIRAELTKIRSDLNVHRVIVDPPYHPNLAQIGIEPSRTVVITQDRAVAQLLGWPALVLSGASQTEAHQLMSEFNVPPDCQQNIIHALDRHTGLLSWIGKQFRSGELSHSDLVNIGQGTQDTAKFIVTMMRKNAWWSPGLDKLVDFEDLIWGNGSEQMLNEIQFAWNGDPKSSQTLGDLLHRYYLGSSLPAKILLHPMAAAAVHPIEFSTTMSMAQFNSLVNNSGNMVMNDFLRVIGQILSFRQRYLAKPMANQSSW